MKTIDSRKAHDSILCIGEEAIYIYILKTDERKKKLDRKLRNGKSMLEIFR